MHLFTLDNNGTHVYMQAEHGTMEGDHVYFVLDHFYFMLEGPKCPYTELLEKVRCHHTHAVFYEVFVNNYRTKPKIFMSM